MRTCLLPLLILLAGCPDGEGTPPPATCSDLEVRPGSATASQWESGEVGIAFGLEVEGGGTASNVQINDFKSSTGDVLQPTDTPVVIDEVVGEEGAVVQAVVGGWNPDGSETVDLTIGGTWETGGETCDFSFDIVVPPLRYGDGSIDTIAIQIDKQTVERSQWPPGPTETPEEIEPPELRPIVPPGPPRNFFPQDPPPSETANAALPPDVVPGNAAEFTQLDGLGGGAGGPPDPAVVADPSGDTVLYSVNTWVGWSDDVGANFTTVNLFTGPDPANPGRTSFFPQDEGGLCCDQVLAYSARYDLYIWILQYWPNNTTGSNRLRMAWATPQAMQNDFANAWTWADITSAVVGIGNDWMDYPDITVTDQHVYVSVDHAISGTGQAWVNQRIFTRWSLADMADTGKGTVGGAFIDLQGSNLIKNHFLRNSPSDGYWAAPSDTSTLTVYRWPGDSGTISWSSVPMTSYSTADYSSNAPDGTNWNAAPKNVLGGAYVSKAASCPDGPCDGLGPIGYFAFSAGRNTGANRAHPYVRIEAVELATWQRVTEVDIWNANFAFSTPSLCSELECDDHCDVAMAVAVGGGGNYANHSVGFLYDWLVYVTTNSTGTGGRFGDYYTVLPSRGPDVQGRRGMGYSSLGYDMTVNTPGTTCAAGCTATPRYVQFGRPGELTNP